MRVLLLALLASAPTPQQSSALLSAYHGRTEWAPTELEGYANRSSIRPGETLSFHVSARAPYRVEIVRCGAREQLVQKAEDLPARLQPVREASYQEGCGWEPSFLLPIPESWSSGLYKARLLSGETGGYEIPFIVRPARTGERSRARILTLTPDITVQAYNSYGGRNVYGTPMGKMSPLISFERPFDQLSPGTLDRQWSLDFLAWLEGELDGLDYASDTDLHREPNLLDGYDLLVLFGHHEYWTREMRDAVDAFIGNGGNLYLVGSKVSYWQIRLDENARNFRCHKKPWEDPIFPDPLERRRATSLFAAAPAFDPPETTFGISLRQANCSGSGPGDICARLPITGTPPTFSYQEGFGHYRLAQPEHAFVAGDAKGQGALFGVGAFGSRVDERMISVCGELDGANMEGIPGGRASSRASGSPSNLLILADAPTVNGFATVASFRNQGQVFHTGSLCFLHSGMHPELHVSAVREFLSRALHGLISPQGNLIRNGGFERWDGSVPLHYRCGQKLRSTPRASGGKRALHLFDKRMSVTQEVAIPKRAQTLHLSFYAKGLRPKSEVVVHKDGVVFTSVPIEPGNPGFHYGRCKVPVGVGNVLVTIRKSIAGGLIVDDLELLTDLAFRRRAWRFEDAAETSGPQTIPVGRHTGGERLLVTFEARALGGAGELHLVSRATADEPHGEDLRLGGSSFSGDWERYHFEARDPRRGTRPAFLFELLPFKGNKVEVRGLHVLPLDVPSPQPESLLLAESDSISSEASADEPSSTIRRLGPLKPIPYLLTGWARGEAMLSIGTQEEPFVTKRISSDTLIPLQEEFLAPELPAAAGRITLEVPAGGDATLRDVRLRPKSEVVENDHISNGAFEIVPSPKEIAAGLNWSDRPPGWVTLDDTRLLLDRDHAYRGKGSLRIRSESRTGGAQYLLPDHLPVTSPLRLHARIRMEPGTKASVRLMATVFQPDRAEIEVVSCDVPEGSDWQALSLAAPPNMRFDKDYPARGWVRVEVQEGTLWVDDLIVEQDSASVFDGENER